jgi:hypothetical protein
MGQDGLEEGQLQLLIKYKEKFARLELICWGSEFNDSYIHQMLVHTVHHSDSLEQCSESLEMLYIHHKKKHVKMFNKEQVQAWHMQVYGPLRKELKWSAAEASEFLDGQLEQKVGIYDDPQLVVGKLLDMMSVGRTKSDGKVEGAGASMEGAWDVGINPKLWRVHECVGFEEESNMHRMVRWVDPNNEAPRAAFKPEFVSLQETIFEYVDVETAIVRYAEDLDTEKRQKVRDKEVEEVF